MVATVGGVCVVVREDSSVFGSYIGATEVVGVDVGGGCGGLLSII